MNDVLLPNLAEIRTPGIAVAICDRNGIVWSHARGHADGNGRVAFDLDTISSACSITKTLTAAAILVLRDAGLLFLDEPIAAIVPEARAIRYPTADCAPMTLRHLLTHTSGLPRGIRELRAQLRREPEERELLEHLGTISLEYAPHTQQKYSNLGYALLGMVVARRSGMPYSTFVKERVLEPLGIQDAAMFEPDERLEHAAVPHSNRDGAMHPAPRWNHGSYAPAGGLNASVQSLVRWIRYQISAWPPRDEPDDARPLSRSTLRESHRIGGLQRPGRNGSCLGWAIDRGSGVGDLVHHSGGSPIGYASFAGFEPTLGIGIVGLANADVDLEGPLGKVLQAFAVSRGLIEDRRR